ncbi:hypothetical protein WJX74_004004 [Apatococcus lobatus]|uniref:Kinesin motor domain-containing protein n=1 Tax=Apatococcus lobatus TaxID=904363 RepID=A0AAW1RQY2_9CHLO
MENISVSVRVRPLSQVELEKGSAWKVDNNKITACASAREQTAEPYSLDNVFNESCTTEFIYKHTTQEVVAKVIGGFNGTVFAYGQTSSGKTHTIRGTAGEPGIISLAVAEVFDRIEQRQDREFLLRVSYMELYNEEVHDLLARNTNTKLQIHESKESGVYVAGLREDIVTSAENVLHILDEGEGARHFGETRMNKQSSRSHTVFRMVVESRARDAEEAGDGGAVWVSTLTLVDLAGSERLAKTGAEGLRMKEGTSINKSLLTLGTVINKLSEGVQVQGGHIPYRDSKLTRILQPSLGGNAKTVIICNLTPAMIHADESHSTLRFACRAKRVVNNAVVNEVLSDAAVLKRQAREIEDLRKALAGTGNAEVEEQIAHLRAELLHKEQENTCVQLQLQQEVLERERAQKKIDGLTRLMLEGAKQEGDEGSKPRKENRRETWCPGGFLNPGAKGKKRALPGRDQSSGSPQQALADATNTAGKDGQAESSIGRSPPPKRHSLEGGLQAMSFPMTTEVLEEAAAETAQPAVAEPEDTAGLRARIKELEMEQKLMQAELDSVSELAQRMDSQLRSAEDELMATADERDSLAEHLEVAKQDGPAAEQQEELKHLQKKLAASPSAELEEANNQVFSDAEELSRLAAEVEAVQHENAALREDLQRHISSAAQPMKDKAQEETLASAGDQSPIRMQGPQAEELAAAKLQEAQVVATSLQAEVEQLRAAKDQSEADWSHRLDAAAAAASASQIAVDDRAAEALAALMSNHADDIAKIQGEHSLAIATAQQDAAASSQQLQAQQSQEIEALSMKAIEERASEAAALDTRHQQAVGQLLAQQLQEVETIHKNLGDEHASAIAALETSHQDAMQQLTIAKAQEAESLLAESKSDHASQIAALKDSHSEAMSQALDAAASDMAAAAAAHKQELICCQQHADEDMSSHLAAMSRYGQEAQHMEVYNAVRLATEASEAEVDKLTGQVAQLVQEHKTLIAQHASQVEALKLELTQAMQESISTPEHQQQTSKGATTADQPQSMDPANEQLQKDLRAQEQDMRQMHEQHSQQVSELESRAQAQLEQIEKLHEVQADLSTALEAAQQQAVVTLRLEAPANAPPEDGEHQNALAATEARTLQIEDLQKRLEEAHEKLQQVAVSSSKTDGEVSDLQAELQNALQAQSEAEAKLAACHALLETCEANLEQVSEAKESAQKGSSAAQEALRMAESAVTEKTAELAAADLAMQQLQQGVASAVEQCQHQKALLVDMKQQSEAHEANLEAAQESVRSLREELAASETKSAQLEKELAATQQLHAEEILKQTADESTVSAETKQLQQQLDAAVASRQQLEAEAVAPRQGREEASIDTQSLQAQLAIAANKLAEAEESSDQQLQEARQKLEEAQASNAAQLQASSDELQQLQTILQQQVAATKDLEGARVSAVEELQSSQQLVATLQAGQADFERRLQAAGVEADAKGHQSQADLEAAQEAQAELEAKLQQAEEAAVASSARAAAAEEGADEAALKAEADVAAIRQALSAANMAKAEMDAKLAKAAVAMNAAEELKEARRQHKEQLAALQQQLKSASHSSKGGEKESERIKKELDKTREKLSAAEQKLRGAVQDKQHAVTEKAALEREVKTLKGQAGKLTKDLDKRDAVADKRVEHVTTDLAKLKAEKDGLQDQLLQATSQLEHTRCELQTSQGECSTLAADLQGAQSSGADLMQQREDLTAQAASLNKQLTDLQAAHEALRAECDTRQGALDEASSRVQSLSTSHEQLQGQHAELQAHAAALQGGLQSCREALEVSQQDFASAQGQLPLIGKLQQQVQAVQEEMGSAQFQWDEERLRLAAIQEQLTHDLTTVQAHLQQANQDREALQGHLAQSQIVKTQLEATIAGHEEYQSQIEGQLNEIELENQQLKSSIEDLEGRCNATQSQQQSSADDVQRLQAAVDRQHAQAQALAADLEAARSAAAALEQTRASLGTELATAGQQQEQLQQQLQHAQAHQAAESALAEHQREAAAASETRWQGQVQDLEASLESWREHCESLTSQKAQQHQSLQAELQASQSKVAELEQMWKLETSELQQSLAQRDADLTAIRVEQGAVMQQAKQAQAELRKALDEHDSVHARLRRAEQAAALASSKAGASQQELQSQLAHLQQRLAQEEGKDTQVAQLHSQVQELSSRLGQAQEKAQSLEASHNPPSDPQPGPKASGKAGREVQLESELRRSKRREEKLQALLYCLREDVKASGGNLEAFQNLHDVRKLEYELDFVTNRAARDTQALKDKIAQLQGAKPRPASASPLAGNKENMAQVGRT